MTSTQTIMLIIWFSLLVTSLLLVRWERHLRDWEKALKGWEDRLDLYERPLKEGITERRRKGPTKEEVAQVLRSGCFVDYDVEAGCIEQERDLNCPACGGSGHIDDVRPEPAPAPEPDFDHTAAVMIAQYRYPAVADYAKVLRRMWQQGIEAGKASSLPPTKET